MLHSTSAKRAHQADTMGFKHDRPPSIDPRLPRFVVKKRPPPLIEDDFLRTVSFSVPIRTGQKTSPKNAVDRIRPNG